MYRRATPQEIKERTLVEATTYLSCACTIRDVASAHETSKSTVFKDLTEVLPSLDGSLYNKVDTKLQHNRLANKPPRRNGRK